MSLCLSGDQHRHLRLPQDAAARIAVDTVTTWQAAAPHLGSDFRCFRPADLRIYAAALLG